MSEVINHNIMSFHGQLTYDQINQLLEDLQKKLEDFKVDTIYKKRLYSSAVEALENILRHSTPLGSRAHPPRFEVIFKNNNSFMLKICNIVTIRQKQLLLDRLNFINDNFGHLKKIFAAKLKNSSISEEGGAGLGMYIIGKNATEKLSYSFTDLNKKQSYFCLLIKI